MAIRYKLAAAMALPMVTFILVFGLEVRQVHRDTDDVRRQTGLAAAANGPTGLLTGLQDERSWIVSDQVGQAGQIHLRVRGTAATRRHTDAAITAFQKRLAHSDEQTQRAFAPALDGLPAKLKDLRARIDADTHPHTLLNVDFANATFTSYSDLIRPFFTGTTQVAAAIDRSDLRQGAELIDVAARQSEVVGTMTRDIAVTAVLSPGGIDTREEISMISSEVSMFQRNAAMLRSSTTGPFAGTAGDELFVTYTDAVTEQVDAAFDGQFDLGKMLGATNLPNDKSYSGYQRRVADIVSAKAHRLNAAAARSERIDLAVIAATILLALIVMLVVSLSITRPLKSLTRQAVAMANHGLSQAINKVLHTRLGADVAVPELSAITVQTGDEVAEVAKVLNTVQESALQLAVGQAVLRRNLSDSFVSLGRRNQNLLGRQLDFITELEQNETDPEALAQLFQLDHLATRMRRNAESLLVLAGNASPRRWSAPVRVADIIRAAVSEVENYQRVTVRVMQPVAVFGSAVADLAHLLAELIENALLFSPPDQYVEIRGLAQPNGYCLAIIDVGVGMRPEELHRANLRLAGSESFTVAPSKYLGHYVAGRLAVRHDIRVQLQPTQGGGITATVLLPTPLLTPEPPLGLGQGVNATPGHGLPVAGTALPTA
jgi:signal transduction histidine kinase